MNSIDELWDEPLAPISPPKQLFDIVDDDDDAPQPSKRPLFLESDSDNDNPTTQTPDDIANLFEDLDVPDHERIEGITPSMDLDALRRAANARHAVNPNPTPYEVVPSSPTRGGEGGGNQDDDDDGAIKKRKTIPRLDEGLLLSDIGIPALVKDAKKFKAKGKGHEASDLNRLLTVYQYWVHQLYPRNQFGDTIQRVEKLCHSRRMHVALSVWYDESKGLINGKRPEDLVEIDPDSDEENAADDSLPDATRPDPPTRPPSSASERSNNEEDLDMDVMIQEDEERQLQSTSSAPAATRAAKSTVAGADEFEDEFDVSMWEDMAFADDPVPGPSNPVSKPSAHVDEDQDMWDVVAELEAETPAAKAAVYSEKPMETAPAPPPSKPTASSSYLDDWDDMYA